MPAAAPNPKLVAARPAESLTIAGAIAFLIARALGVDNDTTMTALTMVIAFTPAAVTWLVELFSRGRAEAPETSRDAVADELKDLNKTFREAVASRSRPEPPASAADASASNFVDAVERVLEARKAESDKRETVADLLRELIDAARMGLSEPREVRASSRAARQSTD